MSLPTFLLCFRSLLSTWTSYIWWSFPLLFALLLRCVVLLTSFGLSGPNGFFRYITLYDRTTSCFFWICARGGAEPGLIPPGFSANLCHGHGFFSNSCWVATRLAFLTFFSRPVPAFLAASLLFAWAFYSGWDLSEISPSCLLSYAIRFIMAFSHLSALFIFYCITFLDARPCSDSSWHFGHTYLGVAESSKVLLAVHQKPSSTSTRWFCDSLFSLEFQYLTSGLLSENCRVSAVSRYSFRYLPFPTKRIRFVFPQRFTSATSYMPEIQAPPSLPSWAFVFPHCLLTRIADFFFPSRFISS